MPRKLDTSATSTKAAKETTPVKGKKVIGKAAPAAAPVKAAKGKVSKTVAAPATKKGRPAAAPIADGTDNPAATAIRKLRKALGIEAKDLAAKCGLHHSAVNRLERADYYRATVAALLGIAKATKQELVISFRPLK